MVCDHGQVGACSACEVIRMRACTARIAQLEAQNARLRELLGKAHEAMKLDGHACESTAGEYRLGCAIADALADEQPKEPGRG